MALKMGSGSNHVSPNPAPAVNSTQPPAAPVYGPEPPPSMARDKAKLPAMRNGGSGSSVLRSESLKHIEGEVHQLFRSRLLAMMAEYGYTQSAFSEADIATVMVARGLMKSPSDDVNLAIASELKDDMWQIVRNHMKSIAESAGDADHLADIPAIDPWDFDQPISMCRHYHDVDDDDEDVDDGLDDFDRDALFRILRGSVPKDIISGISVLTSTHKPPAPQVTPPAAPAARQVITPEHQLGSEPGAVAGSTENGLSSEAKSQKKKKKRNKKKSRGKGKQGDGDAVEGAEYATPQPAGFEQPRLPAVARPPGSLPPPELQPPPSRLHGPPLMIPGASSGWQPLLAVGRESEPPPVTSRSSGLKKADPSPESHWNNDTSVDHTQVRSFWLSLSEIEQQALVMVEKEVVLARVRDQQNFSCSCSSCTRKREAIECELDCLYDCYYEELKENVRKAKLRIWIVSARKKAQSVILNTVEALTDSVVKKLMATSQASTREEVQRTIIGCLKDSPEAKVIFGSEFYRLIEVENVLQSATLSEIGNIDAKGVEAIRDAAELSLQKQISQSVERYGKGKALAEPQEPAIRDSASSSVAYRQMMGDELLMGDDNTSEPNNNNDLFYTDQMLDSIDTFPADSKKFFEMMERLADYRIRREDAMLGAADGIANLDVSGGHHDNALVSREPMLEPADMEQLHRRCPDCHGEISESEEQQYYSDDEGGPANGYGGRKRARAEYYDGDDNNGDEEEYDDDDEYSDEGDELILDNGDEDLDDTDDDFDDLDPENAEQEIENGRKVFQLFAARLFEQRVIGAYREKVARDMQRDLIQELEAEEMRLQAKDKRKQKKKQREKEKKRLLQQQKEEERLAKEAQMRAEEERKRAEAERRAQEQEQKRREEAERARKAQEERNRRILEQADRRIEKERAEKRRLEQEREERQRKEQMQKEQAQKKAAKQKAKAQAKAKQRQESPAKHSKTPAAEATLSKPSPPAVAAAPTVSSQPSLSRAAPEPNAAVSVAIRSPAPAPAPTTAAVSAVVAPTVSAAPQTPTPCSVSLLDSLHQLTPTLAPASAFKSSRPSLPMIHPHEAASAAPSVPTLPPMRARANSGPSTQQLQPQLYASAPATASGFAPPGMAMPVAASDVPPEIDAEISSIVGRVMGSSTLQGDLIDGAEWRAGPTDRATNGTGLAHPLSSRSAAFGLGGPLSLLADQGIRRNSMPLNRLARDDSPSGIRSQTLPAMDDEMLAIYAAYGALEKFKRDQGSVSPAGIAHAQYGGYHSAAEISRMNGRMVEGEVWARCVAFAQTAPSKCCLDHAARAVAFVRSAAATSPLAKQSPIGNSTPQSAQQLPAIAEDIFSAFNLRTTQAPSPLLASARAPLIGMSTHPQPRSPMLPSQALSALASAPGPSVPAQPFVQPQAGLGYSPVPQGAPSLFMGPLGMHASPGTTHSQPLHHGSAPPPFSIPSFQQLPFSAAGLGPRHSGDGPIGSMMPPLSMPADSHQAYGLAYGQPSSFTTANPWPSVKQGDGAQATAGLQRRTYVDKFQERENASENMYVHEKEKEQLAALRKKIAEVEKHANELEEHINRKEREAKSG
ncbi:Stress response protein nst1 [Coemansia sp. Cherry 401B]|nr:Stress response protein nst1 [Coemansia sp. Cherry 401B]